MGRGENHQTKGARENNDSYLRAVLDHVRDGIISIREDRIVETFNPAAERIFGYRAVEVIGKDVKMLMPEPFNSRHDSYVTHYLRTGQAKIIGVGRQVRGRRKNGRTVPLDLTVSEMNVRGQRRFIGILRDLTAPNEAERVLRRLNAQLEQRLAERTARLNQTNRVLRASLADPEKNRAHRVQTEKMAALGALVSGLVHEINTPLGICVTAASFLQMKTAEAAGRLTEGNLAPDRLYKYLKTADEALGSIATNLDLAAELVKSFKQVDGDETTEDKRKFDLKAHIDRVLLSLRPKFKKTGHSIKVNGPQKLEILSHPGAISRIVTNLVVNSLTHGFANVQDGRIAVDLSVRRDQCVIRYSDNGHGIPAGDLKKIYDPFFTTARGHGGTGLGMHIVSNLVTRRLNGRIACTSGKGQGTVFTITFPYETSLTHPSGK